MEVVPWLIALGIGALWYRSKTAAPSPSGSGSTCDALEKLGVPATWCHGASSLLGAAGDVLDGISTSNSEMEAANISRNGAPVKSIDPAMPRVTMPICSNGLGGGYATRSTTLQYANGCQPFKNAAGWSKCAEGTHEMTGRGCGTEVTPFSGRTWGHGRQAGGDPLSFADAEWRNRVGNHPAPFPRPVPPGYVAMWHAGVPVAERKLEPGTIEVNGGVVPGGDGTIGGVLGAAFGALRKDSLR